MKQWRILKRGRGTDELGWLDPMVVKELRQAMRRGSFAVPFLCLHLLAALAISAEFLRQETRGFAEFGPFWLVAGLICGFLMPLAGLVLMDDDVEPGNHEMLLLTELTRWRIVRGKFLVLWGMCALTFLSLLPYCVARFTIGGVEWLREAALALFTLGIAAVLAAGAIAASSYGAVAKKILVFLVFVAAALLGIALPGGFAGLIGNRLPWFSGVILLSSVWCYVSLGLALARARLRVALPGYEMKPSHGLFALLVLSPVFVLFTMIFTLGFGGFVALILIGVMAAKLDKAKGET